MSKKGKIIGLVVGIIVAGVIATGVTVVVIKYKKLAPIWKVLEKFTDKNPLILDYIQKDPIKASDTKATDALRSDLVKQDKTKTITKDIAKKITFGHEEIRVGETNSVSATYSRKKISISVKEKEKKPGFFSHESQEFFDVFLTQSLIRPRYCY